MGDLALNGQDTLGRFLSFAQVMAQTRIIDELQAEREQIQYQIARASTVQRHCGAESCNQPEAL